MAQMFGVQSYVISQMRNGKYCNGDAWETKFGFKPQGGK